MSIAKRRRVVLLAAGVLLPLPWASGCSSSGDDSSPAAARRDVAAAARDGVADKGTLRWALGAAPGTFNAFQTNADSGTQRIAGAVLPSLFTLDGRGRPQRNPDYLQAADVVDREPKQVVRYKLNPKAVWTDGRPIGAEDFTAQWKALRGADGAYWTARNAGYDRIAKVEPGDGEHEVEVTFAKPYADWRSLFTPLYPKSVMSDPAAFNDGRRRGLAVSAGPFMMRSTTGGTKSVTLVRNPRWWGDRARLDKLVFKAVPVKERAAALLAGKLDLAEVDRAMAERIQDAAKVPGKNKENKENKGKNGQAGAEPSARHGAAAGTDLAAGGRDAADAMRAWAEANASKETRAKKAALRRLTVRKALEPAYTQLALNGTKGPLADERVRRAVARAIDRKDLAKLVLGPLDLPTKPLGNHLLMAGQQGYKDHSGAIGGKDTHAAQALLADAGWRADSASARQKALGAKTDEQGHDAARDKRDGEQRGGGKQDGGRGAGPDAGRSGRTGRAATAVVRKHGQPLELRFVVPTGAGTAPLGTVGERIARMLEAIGVRTKITKVSGSGYFKDHIASGDYDLALYSWPASAYPATDARPIYAKPQPAADGSLVVEQNYTRVGTDQIDQLFDQAVAELDSGSSRALVSRADARIWAAAGSIPLYQRPQLVAARKTVVNAGAFGFATPRYQDIGFRK
ncbi:ABC transporter family substrate-binding protein [Streptomyces sp. ME19-01-6]|uniref:ABC transporter family substrate-binding protein n=1 Tax=Streptomyces sp. ME19-01-6 TaxID=3028686 RepID=UPI0029BDB0B0|nr:ABC transporter family substrate-binding protein [Streptomyces sp. ME19-01-6]MDX3225824.1 ABC transporter family substrate-binding protein [Streptomyces sp. ME19-01-6]